MAAKQAAQVAEMPVEVIPTTTITQGLSAMLGFDKDADLAANKEAMLSELDGVKSGQVTIAVRDTTIEGREIKKDDYMGIVDGKIVATNLKQKDAAIEMVKQMLDEDSEIITIIYGEEGSKQEAIAIKDAVEEIDEDVEVEIHAGNQPVYSYLISVE